jgi:uncharacterized membrane protein YphA (DoxX/SURF4 family)
MKSWITILRVLVGGLFVFSGFIKFNDPVGFSIKMKEYFEVFAQDLDAQQDSLTFIVSDDKGNELTHSMMVYSKMPDPVIYVVSQKEDEMLELGEDTFNVHLVYVSIGGELVFEESYPYKTAHQTDIQLVVNNASGEWLRQTIKTYSEEPAEETIRFDLSNVIKPQPLLSRLFESLIPAGLWIGLFICIFELVVGYALLIGWKPFFTTFSMLLMIVFFTFLTGYSAVYNKVTDCGCFGDAIVLTPWQSFWKDIVLLVFILVLFPNRRFIKPFFSPKFAYKSVVFMILLSFGYSIYAITYLPPLNFLNFANGNDLYKRTLIPPGKPTKDSVVYTYFYKDVNTQKVHTFNLNDAPVGQEGWEFMDREERIIHRAYKPKMDNFIHIMHPDLGDVSEQILKSTEYQLLMVSEELTDVDERYRNQLLTLAKEWVEQTSYPIWFISGSSFSDIKEFESLYRPAVSICSADKTFVKSIIRSNPGIILLKGSVVVKNWPARRLPSYKRLSKRIRK